LAGRQRGYARRVLRAAAAAVTSAGYTLESLAAEVKAKREALKEAEHELDATTARLGEEEAQELALAAQIDGLKESGAYQAGGDLHRLRTEAQAAHEAAARLRDQAAESARAVTAKQEVSAHAAASARTAAALADRARAEARHAAERAGLLTVHEETERAGRPVPHDGTEGPDSEAAVHRARELLRAAVTSRSAQIREVRAGAIQHEEAINRRTAAEHDRDRARDDLATAQEAHERAGRLRDDRARDLAAGLADWAGGCTQLQLDPGTLAGLADDFEQADELVATARTMAAVELAAREQHLSARREGLTAERTELARERESLNDRTVLEPPVPHTRGAAARAGRPGVPLWRAVAFRSGLDPVAQAGVEAALEASGLLDLWLRPDGGFDPGEHDAFAVAALSKPAPGYSLAHVLVTEAESPVPADPVLAGIAFAPTAIGVDHPAVVGADGTWRLGPAAGRWVKPEPSYVGATARERARRR
ncbi:hypothetical protein ACWEPC_57970, partial [Nonomuraea sp. NPDC004297]